MPNFSNVISLTYANFLNWCIFYDKFNCAIRYNVVSLQIFLGGKGVGVFLNPYLSILTLVMLNGFVNTATTTLLGGNHYVTHKAPMLSSLCIVYVGRINIKYKHNASLQQAGHELRVCLTVRLNPECMKT